MLTHQRSNSNLFIPLFPRFQRQCFQLEAWGGTGIDDQTKKELKAVPYYIKGTSCLTQKGLKERVQVKLESRILPPLSCKTRVFHASGMVNAWSLFLRSDTKFRPAEQQEQHPPQDGREEVNRMMMMMEMGYRAWYYDCTWLSSITIFLLFAYLFNALSNSYCSTLLPPCISHHPVLIIVQEEEEAIEYWSSSLPALSSSSRIFESSSLSPLHADGLTFTAAWRTSDASSVCITNRRDPFCDFSFVEHWVEGSLILPYRSWGSEPFLQEEGHKTGVSSPINTHTLRSNLWLTSQNNERSSTIFTWIFGIVIYMFSFPCPPEACTFKQLLDPMSEAAQLTQPVPCSSCPRLGNSALLDTDIPITPLFLLIKSSAQATPPMKPLAIMTLPHCGGNRVTVIFNERESLIIFNDNPVTIMISEGFPFKLVLLLFAMLAPF